ncbi:PREDICTED: uncharacterized protein LOC109480288 [Branchiostoma belcheri]|uniref:Uncharacterized protein LOC109480288 n=1 Tax=Branchiostoma belcheri TaxID=7741 RepID=A0A6P5A488_BRABE|nr:PREDICTED: uncharacterized protein LOC109480288 [Branchiostoma belcheri]
MCLENQVHNNTTGNNTVTYNTTVTNTTQATKIHRTVVPEDRSEKQHITMGLILALAIVGLFCIGLILVYIYRKHFVVRNNDRQARQGNDTGKQIQPAVTVAMKSIKAKRASSLPIVALQDMLIFNRLHRCTHLQRQYSAPNVANKNRRGASFDAPHYWEIPDALVDSTYQPAPGKLDAPHYWEIPDALVDFVPTSDTPREIPDALVNPTRQPTKDERDEAHYWEIPDADTIPCPHSPLQTVSDNTTNSTPRPPSLQHQYCNIPDEDGDSTTFYASAVGAKYSTVTKSEDNSRLYEGVASRSTATPQTGDGHSIPATYGTRDFQTASVLVPDPEN